MRNWSIYGCTLYTAVFRSTCHIFSEEIKNEKQKINLIKIFEAHRRTADPANVENHWKVAKWVLWNEQNQRQPHSRRTKIDCSLIRLFSMKMYGKKEREKISNGMIIHSVKKVPKLHPYETRDRGQTNTLFNQLITGHATIERNFFINNFQWFFSPLCFCDF